ncbi:MAG: response regulator, partial [Methylophaga sp.]|nr:response regulator [Methylophaga sp.]
GEFLANMSHAIRTPLNVVVGTLNLLSDTDLNTSQKNLVDVSKRSADTLLGLINDILDLSKIESGKLNIIREPVNLLGVVNEAAKAFASRAEAKQISLLCPNHYLPPYLVWSDGLRLRQNITNLLSNAVKFTQKGEITIDLQVQELTDKRLHFRLNVTDSGPGISLEQQARLFQRFQQLDSSLTRKEGGTGLGLAICRQLIDLMGGRIGVESEEGQGARFWFEMTLERHHDENLDLNKPFGSLELFIVGATPLYRSFYQSVLNAWGVHYQHHPDFKSALAAMDATDSVHQLMVVDAEFLHQEAQHTESLQLKKPLLVTCPQSMLGDLPASLRENANLIVSYPLVQSELYNALLSIVDEEAVQQMGTAVIDNSPTEFEASVLVVEDNSMNVTIVKGLLEKFGVSVSVAENGIEALSKLRQESYDLVLMDCQMPEMDGYQATQRLREDPSMLRNDVVVIALTAHAMREDEQKCLDAGMDDYLSKPVDPQLLNQKLSQWLPPKCLRQFAS